jgi:hypothetical protein
MGSGSVSVAMVNGYLYSWLGSKVVRKTQPGAQSTLYHTKMINDTRFLIPHVLETPDVTRQFKHGMQLDLLNHHIKPHKFGSSPFANRQTDLID